jgi:uncharacterized membrane protein (GlpM family)
MGYLILKGALTGAIVIGIAELAKKSSLLGAILASLPLTSILAMIWLYLDTKDVGAVRDLSVGIFWMVIPSLFFFLILPVLLKTGMRFPWALLLACGAMSLTYWGYNQVLGRFGVKL